MQIRHTTLPCGLRLVHHRDAHASQATVSLLYGVGSADERPDKTGLAHLLEHLMFAGTPSVPDYDTPIQEAGGENNAFTTADHTIYQITLPAANLPLALCLESDRLQHLDISARALEIQRKVVIEEFRQTHTNRPYGDLTHQFQRLLYSAGHPYSWPTIGLQIRHIRQLTLEDVRQFHRQYYRVDNAVLAITSPHTFGRVARLAEQYFGAVPRPAAPVPRHDIPLPVPTRRQRTLHRDVPQPLITTAYHIPSHTDADYTALDVITDILSLGAASRFNTRLVQQTRQFTQIDAFVEPHPVTSLLIIEAIPAPSTSIPEALRAIKEQLRLLADEPVTADELTRAKNKFHTDYALDALDAQSLTDALALHMYYTPDRPADHALTAHLAVTSEDLQRVARQYLRPASAHTLVYQPKG